MKIRNLIIMLVFLITLNKDVVAAETIEINNSSIELITNNNLLGILIMFIIGITFIIIILKSLTNKKEIIKTELTDEDIKNIDEKLSFDILKEETFNLYKKLETAKTKQNTKNLKYILTEDLYLEQEQKIKTQKENNQKVVATNIKVENFKVLSITVEKNIKTISTYLHVSQYDYITDKKKNVVRGTNESVYQIEYKITLEQINDNQFKIKKRECLGKWIKNY